MRSLAGLLYAVAAMPEPTVEEGVQCIDYCVSSPEVSPRSPLLVDGALLLMGVMSLVLYVNRKLVRN